MNVADRRGTTNRSPLSRMAAAATHAFGLSKGIRSSLWKERKMMFSSVVKNGRA